MDLDYLLRWFIGVSCVMHAWPLVQRRPAGWQRELVAPLAVLAVLAAGLEFALAWAGWASAAAYALLIWLPGLLVASLGAAAVRTDVAAARRIALVLGVLRPLEGWWSRARAYGLIAMAKRLPPAASLPLLRRLGGTGSEEARMAVLLACRIEGHWAGYREWVEQDVGVAALEATPDVTVQYLRALGETGAVEEMLARALALARREDAGAGLLAAPWTLACLFAFAGRVETVERLIAGPLAAWPPHVRDYWRGTARLAAGDAAGGSALIAGAVAPGDHLAAADVAARLARPLPAVELSPRWLAFVEQLERATLDRLHRVPGASGPRPVVTWALLMACIGTFGVELLVAFTHPEADPLLALGALVPSLVAGGQWWRMIAALFLHAGVLHLGVNAYALYILGPPVERALGRARFAALYFIAGLGSMAAVVALTLSGAIEDNATVGASGAILGLVGALAALVLRHRFADWRQRLARIGLVVAVQVLFDVFTPQVSMAGHMGGLIAGFAAGLLLAPGRQRGQ